MPTSSRSKRSSQRGICLCNLSEGYNWAQSSGTQSARCEDRDCEFVPAAARVVEQCFPCHDIVFCVATISRLLKIIGLLCKRTLQKSLYSAKETYNLKESTNHSHLILCVCLLSA